MVLLCMEMINTCTPQDRRNAGLSTTVPFAPLSSLPPVPTAAKSGDDGVVPLPTLPLAGGAEGLVPPPRDGDAPRSMLEKTVAPRLGPTKRRNERARTHLRTEQKRAAKKSRNGFQRLHVSVYRYVFG